MDQEFYRQVPYRFFNESNTDACKLEKLTNLFPDMKATIELGIIHFLFKKQTNKNNFFLKNYLKLTIYHVQSIVFHVYIQF
jgi:hypothetical protein